MEQLIGDDETLPYRQITIVDSHGRTAAYSGEHTLGVHCVVEGDGVVAAGNLLSSESVPDKMLEAYSTTDGDRENRLLGALLADEAAGGEQDEIRSCGLAVVRGAG